MFFFISCLSKHKIMIMSNSFLYVFLMMPGGTEWIIILLAVVLLFGGKKIPELMKGIGKGVRDFTDAKNNLKDEIEEGMKPNSSKQPAPSIKEQL